MAENKTDTAEVERLTRQIREYAEGREVFIDQAEKNDQMFMGRIQREDMPARGHNYFLINMVAPAVISHAQTQLETRPRTSVHPRQSRAEPEYWISRRALNTIAGLIQNGVLTGFDEWAEQPASPETVDAVTGGLIEEEVPMEDEGFNFKMLTTLRDAESFRVTESFMERIKPLIEVPVPPGTPQQPTWTTASGQPMLPFIRQRDVATIDDTMTAATLDNMLTIAWEKDDDDQWLMENVLNSAKFGAQAAAYTWNKETLEDHLVEIHIKNLFLPKNCNGIRDAESAIVREILSRDEAMKKYPYAKGAIERYAPPKETGGAISDMLGQNEDDMPWTGIDFGRDMLVVWHWWERNHAYKWAPDDAIMWGRVVLKGDKWLLTDPENDFAVTTEETDPSKANWPKRNGIKYRQFIGEEKVQDVENPHADIPIVMNRNIPISYQPWGQGEPERLWYPQKMLDKIASILHDHLLYYRSPQQIFPAGIYKKLKGINQLHSYPGRDALLEDGAFDNYRDFFLSGRGFTIDPPKLTQGYVELWMNLFEIFDKISGHQAVMQGQSPGANSSGKKVELLQTAARGIAGFKAFNTEAMLKQLARLRIHAFCKFLPDFMWERMNDHLPNEVIGAIRRRARKGEFDVSIELSSGTGQIRQRREDNTIFQYKSGLRSPQSARSELGIEKDDPFWQPPMPAQSDPGASGGQQDEGKK